jgi:uncharacterized membrane protein YhaH (DUF805 family)/ribosomal protein L37AE/L43A
MNTNVKQTGSAELSLQTQTPTKVCPKCEHKRTDADAGPDWQCPKCGIAYNKARPVTPPQPYGVSPASLSAADREEARDDFKTATPPLMSLSMTGRIGRLRYLAFACPMYLAAVILGMLAAVIVPLQKTGGIVLVVLGVVLCFWFMLRLMALRLHDLNLSAKWLLALLLLPAVGKVLGGSQLMLVAAALFWLAALGLLFVGGSKADNDYGPPPGENTSMVKAGAGVVLAIIALSVVVQIRLGQSGKLATGSVVAAPK